MEINKLLIFAWATVVALGIFIGVMAYLYGQQPQFDNTPQLGDSPTTKLTYTGVTHDRAIP